MAKSKQQLKLGLEVLGVLLLALTILMAISLFSYHPTDEAANLVGGSRHNLAGVVGAYLADGMVQSTGLTAYLLPWPILLLALNCFIPAGKRFKAHRFGGILLGLIALCPLLALHFQRPLTIWGIRFEHAGGIAGDMARKLLLLPYLNTWGAYLIAGTLFLIGIMLATGLSLQALAIGLAKAGQWIATTLKRTGCQLNRLFSKAGPSSKPRIHSSSGKSQPKIKAKPSKPEPTPPQPIIATTPAPAPPSKAEKEQEEGLELNAISPLAAISYQKPDLHLLDPPKTISLEGLHKGLLDKSKIIEDKLQNFGVEGRISQVHLGPVITRYEFEPAAGVKINKVANLADDLALVLKAHAVRIVAPIPGKAAVGIEVPNKKRQIIYLREILAADRFRQSSSCLTLALGKDTEGNPYVTDLAGMPHLLIAGATGSGKSVALNTIICSILYKASPAQVRFVMVDPKMLELGIYNGIPHLLGPVVNEPKKAAAVLHWAAREMEDRYQRLANAGVRNIDQYNQLLTSSQIPESMEAKEGEAPPQPLPYIVIVIDEFADLMLMAAKDIEGVITRLAQMARAVGIHLIVATQRPSVDVITGLIKANFPCRISFRVASKIDSRTILDVNGAEKLLGMGDMLFIPPRTAFMKRIHGAMVSEREVKAIVDFLTEQVRDQEEQLFRPPPAYEKLVLAETGSEDGTIDEDYDEFYDQAVDLAVKTGQASISMIQRRFRIGYNRAARIVELMERDGVVGQSVAGKPRKVLVGQQEEGGIIE